MARNNPKAIGWTVVVGGAQTMLCKPGQKDAILPRGVSKILLLSGRGTVFPDRRSAQKAVDNTKKYIQMNNIDWDFKYRIVTLYEPKT